MNQLNISKFSNSKPAQLLWLCLILLFVLITTGCWNRRELDRIALVSAVGIEKSENGKIELIAQIRKPGELKTKEGGGGKPEQPVWIVNATGETVFEAVRNFVPKSGRKLYLPHMELILIDEEVAREGIAPIVAFFQRDHEARLRTWVLIAKGAKPKDILQVKGRLEKVQAEQIERMMQELGSASKAVAVNLLDLSRSLASESANPVIGTMEMQTSITGSPEIVFHGAAVFQRDKLIDWLTPRETRGYLWIRNKVKGGITKVPCPGSKDTWVALEILRSNTKIHPVVEGEKVEFTIEVTPESNLGEVMCAAKNLATPEMMQTLEASHAKLIKSEIKDTVEKAQKELKVDFLGLGKALERQFPDEWEAMREGWDQQFPKVDVKVKVNAKLKRTGMLGV